MATQEAKQQFLAKVQSYEVNTSRRLAIEIYEEFLDPLTAKEGFSLIPETELAEIRKKVADYKRNAMDRVPQQPRNAYVSFGSFFSGEADSELFKRAVQVVGRMAAMPTKPHPMQSEPVDPAIVDQVRARLRGLDAMAIVSQSIALRYDDDKRRAIDRLDDYFKKFHIPPPSGLSTAKLVNGMIEKLERSRLTVNFNAQEFFKRPLDQIGSSYKTCWQLPAKTDKYLWDRDNVESTLRPFGSPRDWPTPAFRARWIPDAQVKTCQHPGCTAKMAMLSRHHCRLCGNMFCSTHSSHTMTIRDPLSSSSKGRTNGVQHKQRVCDSCFSEHSEQQAVAPGSRDRPTDDAVLSEIERYAKRGSTSFQAGMRPRYAALDFLNARCGGATFYGRSFFVLHRGLLANATLTHTDTFDTSRLPDAGWRSVMASVLNMYPLVAYMEDELLGKLVLATLQPGGVDCMSAGGCYSYLESQVQTDGYFGRDITEVHVSKAELHMIRDQQIPRELKEREDETLAGMGPFGTAADVKKKAEAFALRFGMKIFFVDDSAYPLNYSQNDPRLPVQRAYHTRP